MARNNNVDPKKFAATYAKNHSINKAMVAAGYAPATAKNGRRSLSPACIAELMKRGISLGKKLSAEDRAAWVRGKLIENTVNGQDTAVKSLELLGKDKEVAMFTPDSQVGMIVLQYPPDMNVVAPIKEPPAMPAPVDVIEAE